MSTGSYVIGNTSLDFQRGTERQTLRTHGPLNADYFIKVKKNYFWYERYNINKYVYGSICRNARSCSILQKYLLTWLCCFTTLFILQCIAKTSSWAQYILYTVRSLAMIKAFSITFTQSCSSPDMLSRWSTEALRTQLSSFCSTSRLGTSGGRLTSSPALSPVEEVRGLSVDSNCKHFVCCMIA